MDLRLEDTNSKPRRRKLNGGTVIGIMALVVNAITFTVFVSLHFNLAAQFESRVEEIELTRQAEFEQTERVTELVEVGIELTKALGDNTELINSLTEKTNARTNTNGSP